MHLAIRADGGPSIGFGHLVRTSALATQVLEGGNRVSYLTLTSESVRAMCPDRSEIVALDSDNPHGSFLEWLSAAEPDIVVTDSYNIDTDCQRSIAEQVPRLAVIQDDARFTICADLLINGNVYAPELDHKWTGSEPKWFLGLDYLLLREEIRKLAAQTPPFKQAAERALITMGGSDIRGTTPDVVRAFDGMDLEVDVIVGPGFENQRDIEVAIEETEARITIVVDPDDLPRRMFEADLAVSATGSTIYELLALGTPSIGLPQARNQELISVALEDRGMIISPPNGDIAEISSAVNALAGNAVQRREIRERGRRVVDGRGVERVYDALLEGVS